MGSFGPAAPARCAPPLRLIREFLDNSANRKWSASTLSPPEGRVAIVTKRWAWGAMDAAGVRRVAPSDETQAADGEAAWSRRRDLALRRRDSAGNGGKKGRFPGEHEGNRNTIAQGKPGCPGRTRSS